MVTPSIWHISKYVTVVHVSISVRAHYAKVPPHRAASMAVNAYSRTLYFFSKMQDFHISSMSTHCVTTRHLGLIK